MGGEEGTNPPVEDSGNNPAWSEVLGVIPEELHETVTPFFQQWDQSVQSKIEQANAQLKNYEAYQPFIEHEITPDEIEQGLRLMFELNNNPQNVWEALGKTYNLGGIPSQGTSNGEDEEDDEGYEDPQYNELRQGLDLVSKIILEEQENKKAQQEDAELDRELTELKTKFGEYDEDYVLAKMERGMSGEDAVKAYQTLVNQARGSAPNAPNILGSGGGGGTGLPSNRIDPAKLTPKATRSLVAQMLDAANRNS